MSNKCEGCNKKAVTSDSEGVPLCQACYDALVIEELKREIADVMKESAKWKDAYENMRLLKHTQRT